MKLNKKKVEVILARTCLKTADIATAANLPLGTVSKVLACRDEVYPTTAGKVCKALGVDVTELLED